MFKLMCLLLLEQVITMLHAASHTLSLRRDVCSSTADIFLNGVNGSWAGMVHKCLHMIPEENI